MLFTIVYSNLIIKYSFACFVPDTGQKKCYDEKREIPCPSHGKPYYGQDAQYETNKRSYTKLDKSGRTLSDSARSWSMVKDNVTGLIWEVKTNDGSIHDKNIKYNWEDSRQKFTKELNSSRFGNSSDWRIPDLKELSSIINNGIHDPSIDAQFFPNTISHDYWSSTTSQYNTNDAYIMNFNKGFCFRFNKDDSYHVRAVHSGQSESIDNNDGTITDKSTGLIYQRFIDNNDGTITDKSTGLIWQKENSEKKMVWKQALEYCEDLRLNDHSDWRLPNVEELRSIIDFSKCNPAINTNFFPNTIATRTFYWSSTTYAYNTEAARGVDYYYGDDIMFPKSTAAYVRAVRSGHSQSFGDLVIGLLKQVLYYLIQLLKFIFILG